MDMILRILFIICFALVSCRENCYGQKNKTASSGQTHGSLREFFTYKEKTAVKEGKYLSFFDEQLLTKGWYSDDKKDGLWEYYDYEGTLRVTGSFTQDLKNGKWLYYYPDGSVASELFYLNGKNDSVWTGYFKNGNISVKKYYVNGLREKTMRWYETGELFMTEEFADSFIVTRKTFFKNGNPFSELSFREGKPHNVIQMLNVNGAPLPFGNFSNGNGQLISYGYPYTENGILHLRVSSKANFSDGLLNGDAEGYDSDEKLTAKGSFLNGVKTGKWVELVDGKLKEKEYDSKPASIKDSHDELILQEASTTSTSIMPEFPGGEKRLLRYLLTVPYPNYAKEKNIQGTVYITFYVNETGEVQEVKILRGVHHVLDSVCLELINRMPRWMPGSERGIPLKVQYTLPVRFRLD